MAVERGSQILAIFDTMGHGVVFDEDSAARFVRKKNLQRMFNYCREGSGRPPFRILQLLLQAVLQPDRRNFYGQSRGPAPRLDLERQSEGVDTRGRVYGECENVCRSFLTFAGRSIDFRSIMSKRTELRPFLTSPWDYGENARAGATLSPVYAESFGPT